MVDYYNKVFNPCKYIEKGDDPEAWRKMKTMQDVKASLQSRLDSADADYQHLKRVSRFLDQQLEWVKSWDEEVVKDEDGEVAEEDEDGWETEEEL